MTDRDERVQAVLDDYRRHLTEAHREIDRLRARVAELEAAGDDMAVRFEKQMGWIPQAWSDAVSPDDAHTTTEYRVTVTRSDGAVLTTYSGSDRYVAERMAGADGCLAEQRTVSPWRELTVSTTTRTTDWKADE